MRVRRRVNNCGVNTLIALLAGLLLVQWPPAVLSGDTKQVTDPLGRQITVPVNPGRIMALAPSITEIVFALGSEDKLAGVTMFSDFPEGARALPKVGSYIHLDLEKIVSLNPDVCIAVKDGNPKYIVDRLESLGIPVFTVDPTDLESVMEAIAAIGGLINADRQAIRVVRDMRARIAHVKRALSGIDDRPRVFFQIGIDPIVSAGSGTFINELIVMAGGQNLAAGGVPYPRFSREQVLNLKPDVMIITSMARDAIFEKVKAYWSQWPGMPAVRDGRIYLQESNIYDRPTLRLVQGLETLSKLLHPDRFKEAK
jgi:iron complex transport system substrate-binding protein